MKPLRSRILALLAAIPILLGLLVPAAAKPCADDGAGPAMTCDVCLAGILPGAPVCAASCQAVPASGLPGAHAPQPESRAWFADLEVRPYGVDRRPEFPPPR